MPEKADFFQIMLENRKTIVEVLGKTNTASQAWEKLCEGVPELGESVKFNTFKAYARFLQVVDKELEGKERLEAELGRVRQTQQSLEVELDKVRQEKQSLESELGKVSKKSKSAPSLKGVEVPKHVDGWGVQRKGDYYRVFKKIGGKVKWIHIGREWNMELAKKKIKTFAG